MYQVNHNATIQAKEYTDKMQPPNLNKKTDPVLRTKADRVKNEQFDYLKQDSFFGASYDPKVDAHVEDIGELLSERVRGELRTVNFAQMCEISVHHGDVLMHHLPHDLTIIPMSPNFMPYKGVGLKVLERGGEEMYREILQKVRASLEAKRKGVEEEVERLARAAGVSINQFDKTHLERQIAMQPGEIIVVESRNNCVSTPLVGFLVLPFFFQGNPMQAAKALAHSWSTGLKTINEMGIRSAVSVHPAKGIYGFEARRHCEIIMENSVDVMLQLDEISPKYALQRLSFVDSDTKVADDLNSALIAQSALSNPLDRVVSAAEWESQHTARVLSVEGNKIIRGKCRRVTLHSFKKYHSIHKKTKTHYRMNIRPFMWRRTGFLNEPAPLKVFKHSGEIAPVEHQDDSTPFHRQRMEYTYFPSPRSTFGYAMRVNAMGELRGWNRMPRTWDGLDKLERSTKNEVDGGAPY